MNNEKNENEKVEVDKALLRAMTKRIVRIERDNSIQKEKSDKEMEESLKRLIEGVAK